MDALQRTPGIIGARCTCHDNSTSFYFHTNSFKCNQAEEVATVITAVFVEPTVQTPSSCTNKMKKRVLCMP